MHLQGTWQFMSVALLLKDTKVVEIPDELESFFWVLIYYAVRYLPSNVKDVGNWLEDHFDTFSFDEGKYVCGTKKQRTFSSDGRLLAREYPPLDLKFGGPLDTFIGECLFRFKKYYRVYNYKVEQREKEKERRRGSSNKSTSTPSQPRAATLTSQNTLEKTLQRRLAGPPRGTRDAVSWDEVEPPTQYDRNMALSVSTHVAMRESLREACLKSNWPESLCVVEDRVPIGWEPKKVLGPVARSKLVKDAEDDK